MKKIIIFLIVGLLVSIISLQAQSWFEFSKTLPVPYPNSILDRYGYSVSIDGDFAVVSTYNGYALPGYAYVLQKTLNGWESIAKLTASDGAPSDAFGYSVAISNNNIIIGTRTNGVTYIFEKPVTGWEDMTETARLSPVEGNSGRFGWSVSIYGNIAIVGDPCDNENGSSSGAAYIFEKPITGWEDMTETLKITASDGEVGDYFGYSVSISENYAIIGAYWDDDNGSNSGSAYIFKKPITGWENITEIAKLTASDGDDYDFFGHSVSISGDNVIVGAYGNDENGNNSGAAYIFQKPITEWENTTETAKLMTSDGGGGDSFGYSVSIAGDNVIVGAYYDDNNGVYDNGSAYIFQKPITGWEDMTETAKLTASDGDSDDYFGHSVSISGDNTIIGAYHDNDNGSESGSIYIFEKPTTNWTNSTETIKLSSPNLSNLDDSYGNSVSIDGNYAVVGAISYKRATGCAYILKNTTNGWINIARLSASDGNYYDAFGSSVSISDNIVIIGASEGSGQEYKSGSAYIFKKPITGWEDMTETAKLTASDGEFADQFGSSVSISGNTVTIGALTDDDNGDASGSAYIFEKPSTGWEDMTETAKLTASDGSERDFFGNSISISGNTIIVGTFGGSAYIFEKPNSGWENMTETAKLTASNDAGDFGSSVCISGEVVIIGAQQGIDDNGSSSGSAYIFEKPNSGWENMTETAKLTASDGDDYDLFGQSVSISGDNAIIGAYGDDDDGYYSGSAYIFEKPNSGWENMTETAKLTASDGDNYDFFGHSVSISGDNAIIGADSDNDSGRDSGSAYIYTKALPEIIIQPDNQNDICAGSEVMFTINSLNTTSFQWQVSTDNGNSWLNISDNSTYHNSSTNSLNIITNQDLNNFQYRCIASNINGNITSNIAILYLDTENPTITCIDNQIRNLLEGQTFYTILDSEFNPTATGDNCEIESTINNLNNSPSLSGETLPVGTTTITWTITDNTGNNTTCNFNVQVNAFAKVDYLQKNGFSIYPNPTNGIINFKSIKNNTQKITIFNVLGETIIEDLNILQNETVDFSNYKSGVYIIKFQTETEIFTTRIIKK